MFDTIILKARPIPMTQRKWLANSLTETVKKMHQQISYCYPSYKKFFSEVEGKTALAFWETYPSPHTLKDMSEEALAAFLRKHSNNGLSHKKANQILTLINAATFFIQSSAL